MPEHTEGQAHGRRGTEDTYHCGTTTGLLTNDSTKFIYGRSEYIRLLLLTIYISLNIFMTMIFMVAGNKCRDNFNTQMQTVVPKTKQIYLQAVAAGMILANSVYIIVFLAVLTIDLPTVWATMKGSQSPPNPPIPTDTTLYKDEKLTFIAKYTTLPVTALIDLFLTVKASHSSHLSHSSKAVKLLGCCCCCCSQRRKHKTLQKTFQTLLWWNVMLFIQIHVGQVALPVVILFIIRSPRSNCCECGLHWYI